MMQLTVLTRDQMLDGDATYSGESCSCFSCGCLGLVDLYSYPKIDPGCWSVSLSEGCVGHVCCMLMLSDHQCASSLLQ